MKKLRVLEVSGSFYEMGVQHAQKYGDAIHEFTEDRIHLSMGELWTGRNISREASPEWWLTPLSGAVATRDGCWMSLEMR
jgi:hypothetical protein